MPTKILTILIGLLLWANVSFAQCLPDLKSLVKWDLVPNSLASFYIDTDGDGKEDYIYYFRVMTNYSVYPTKEDVPGSKIEFDDKYVFITGFEKKKVSYTIPKHYKKVWKQSDRKKLIIVETKGGRMFYYVPQDEREEILVEVTESKVEYENKDYSPEEANSTVQVIKGDASIRKLMKEGIVTESKKLKDNLPPYELYEIEKHCLVKYKIER